MKRFASVLLAIAIVVAGVFVGPAASAWDPGNADGTQSVIAGDNFGNCVIRESAAIYCWGSNSSGQLGRNVGTTPSLTVEPVAAYDQSLAQSIAANGSTVCAVMLTRAVKCWGNNLQGQVGNGVASAVVGLPTLVPGITNATAVSVGPASSCASRQDGTVWCWGTSDWDAFTGFPATLQLAPVKVVGLSNIVDVSLGQFHGCALRADKHVVCWGDNTFGQLGDGTDDPRTGVVVVSGISDATGVVVGYDNSCAIRTGGTVYCWGTNSLGALGARSIAAESPTPIKVYGLSGVSSLAMQGYGGCAVTGGMVKCWGSADTGRLGDGQFVTQYSPVRSIAASLPQPTSTWTSYWGSCEIADGGLVWCWGSGNSGRLGTGSTANAYMGAGPGSAFGYADTPTKVRVLSPAPGTPTGTSPLLHKIKIVWAAPSTAYGTSAPSDYVVQYKLKGTTTWRTFADPVTATRSATVSGLTTGKYYQFRVYPKNWAGTGTVSATSGYIKSK